MEEKGKHIIYAGDVILRGRKEIAAFARINPAYLDQLLDQGKILHWRSGQGPGHPIYTTTRLVLEAMTKIASRTGKI